MKHSEITEADVRILPRSQSLYYATDPYRDQLQTNLSTSGYIEPRYVNNSLAFGDYRIIPNGIDNNFPYDFRLLLDKVYLGHGVKRTLINLLLSGGVGIYADVKEGSKIIRDWRLDNEISDWLDSFDFHTKYIVEAATDMVYVENLTTRIYRNKGSRVGMPPRIASLEFVSADVARLEAKDEKGVINNMFIADWMISNLKLNEIEVVPMWKPAKPFASPSAMMFVKMPTFGSSYYGRPVDIGAVTMLQVLSLLPAFHKANLTERGFKWIVSVASDYYKAICLRKGWDKEGPEFKAWKEAFLQEIDDFLTAPEGDKLQTRFLTEFVIDPHTGNPINSVQITKLQDDTKTLSETGMQLSDTYTVGYVSANGLHPQLGNVNLKNQSLSGSNLREAYEMHIKGSTPTMRRLLLHAANTAIKINFPAKNLKLGFQDIAFEDFTKVQSTTSTVNNQANAVQ